MDASHSPAPSTEGATDTAEQPGQPGRRRTPSLISSLLRRAGGAFSGPSSDGHTDGGDELGPAFDRSTPVERTMVMNILRLRDLRVEDVMIPRADIVAVSEDASLADVLAAFQSGSLSRLPVYHETLDDPIGFVHLKDLALHYGVGCARGEDEFDLRSHLRAALFVPPSMRIAPLLQKMQAERVHMALVIDEFGGVDGIVTIEDLVEQIVGDIEDEHDAEESEQWRTEGPGVYLVDARAAIRDFEEAESVNLLPEGWEEEVDSMGGLVFMLTGRIPARGEVIGHPMGHEFEIADADSRRIRRLRLRLRGSAGADAAPAAALAAAARQAAE